MNNSSYIWQPIYVDHNSLYDWTQINHRWSNGSLNCNLHYHCDLDVTQLWTKYADLDVICNILCWLVFDWIERSSKLVTCNHSLFAIHEQVWPIGGFLTTVTGIDEEFEKARDHGFAHCHVPCDAESAIGPQWTVSLFHKSLGSCMHMLEVVA